MNVMPSGQSLNSHQNYKGTDISMVLSGKAFISRPPIQFLGKVGTNVLCIFLNLVENL